MMTWKFLHAFLLSGLMTFSLAPSGHRGQVKLGGLPVPGAVVTAIRDDWKTSVVTDEQGVYVFPDLADGAWTIQVDMLGFAPIRKDVTVAADAPGVEWDLKILPIGDIAAPEAAVSKPAGVPAAPSASPPQQRPAPPPDPPAVEVAPDLSQSAADGLLINGSVNNAAASPFAQSAAFGNARRSRAVYTGGAGFFLDNSALDARSFSLTGQDTPKPGYNHVIGAISFGGPLRIPKLVRNGPNFFFNYQRTQNRTVATQSALMPTAAERDGDLSAHAGAIVDPATGSPFAGNRIPRDRIRPESRALLSYFPLPNFHGGSRFNYQVPLAGATHQDTIQARANKAINTRNQVFGDVALQRTAADSPGIVGLVDRSEIRGLTGSANWSHRFGNRASATLRYQFSRMTTRVTPHFANRINVSALAGISGNNQEPSNWGPPNLNFASGIAGLSDVQSASNRNQTHLLGVSGAWNRMSHTIQWGLDLRRQQLNMLTQQDARGAFTFTGAATGSDLADFLLGIPTTSSIAFGNADKYFRESVYDAFLADDWRVRSGLTLNLGARWEYEAPMTEKYGRFVNLDIAPGFVSASPVIARRLNPDRAGIQPRLAMAWRPLPASSLIVRAGYGVYRNTSVYQPVLMQMAQQAPLSKSFRIQNSAANPLTLADGFGASGTATPNTFAVDPDFRVGYLHTWTVTVQRDLPASLIMIAAYLGSKGTHLMQQSLPNTYPAGAPNPCPACPSGFAYLTSNGTSRRESGQIQLRRRLQGGFTANVQYTYSKSTDDAGFSAANPLIAQDWLNLKAERAPSSFDQRHQVTAQAQYTTGTGARGGALMSGWRGALFKEWTLMTQITAGSGLPLTPIYPAPVRGTGVTGSIRPDYTGGPARSRSSYSTPAPGRWGNAGRNSIIGPEQFGMDASVSRTVRLNDRVSADIRIDAANILNRATFPRWNMLVTTDQFGFPDTANPMRKIQSSLRIRF